MERESDLLRTLPCPTCARDLPTRVLADSVTLIVIGVCPEHGTAELSRVKLEVAETEPYPSSGGSVAYRPGDSCGRRLEGISACELPPGHEEPHTG